MAGTRQTILMVCIFTSFPVPPNFHDIAIPTIVDIHTPVDGDSYPPSCHSWATPVLPESPYLADRLDVTGQGGGSGLSTNERISNTRLRGDPGVSQSHRSLDRSSQSTALGLSIDRQTHGGGPGAIATWDGGLHETSHNEEGGREPVDELIHLTKKRPRKKWTHQETQSLAKGCNKV